VPEQRHKKIGQQMFWWKGRINFDFDGEYTSDFKFRAEVYKESSCMSKGAWDLELDVVEVSQNNLEGCGSHCNELWLKRRKRV
jgi:hypothetical protein